MDCFRPLNFEVIFVHGIRHAGKEADEAADELARASGVNVEVIKHSRGFVGAGTNPSAADPQPVADLKDRILRNMNAQKEVCLILHSKGADIGLSALYEIDKREGRRSDLKRYVSVYTFGGIVAFPKNIGKKIRVCQKPSDAAAAAGVLLRTLASPIQGGPVLEYTQEPKAPITHSGYPSSTAAAHSFLDEYLLDARDAVWNFKSQVVTRRTSCLPISALVVIGASLATAMAWQNEWSV